MTIQRCCICYESLAVNERYHRRCNKYLFNTEEPPVLDLTSEEVEILGQQLVKQKMGVPGVQRKLSLALDKKNRNGSSRLTIIGTLGGEYILKPPTPDYPKMPEIEDLTMHLANIAGIKVAEHGLIAMHNGEFSYITKRFDRKGKHKIAIEDLCQLSEKLTEQKYRSSSENAAKIVRHYSSFPGDDVLKFFELILFSFIVGNADMHLKNFSLITQNSNDIRFSPCYDLLSTKLLIPDHIDPEELALPVNGKKKNIRKKDFLKFGMNCGIPEKVINHTFEKFSSYFPLWKEMIEKSFIGTELQSKLIELITLRINSII